MDPAICVGKTPQHRPQLSMSLPSFWGLTGHPGILQRGPRLPVSGRATPWRLKNRPCLCRRAGCWVRRAPGILLPHHPTFTLQPAHPSSPEGLPAGRVPAPIPGKGLVQSQMTSMTLSSLLPVKRRRRKGRATCPLECGGPAAGTSLLQTLLSASVASQLWSCSPFHCPQSQCLFCVTCCAPGCP